MYNGVQKFETIFCFCNNFDLRRRFEKEEKIKEYIYFQFKKTP